MARLARLLVLLVALSTIASRSARADAGGCVKLEGSRSSQTSLAARMQLAQCDERAGRTASAWAGYLEVASMAKARGLASRARAAEARAASVEPRLLRLVIDVGGASTPGLTVKRNDVVVPRADYNTPLPVDPGAVTVEVAAPDHQGWQTTIDVTSERRVWEVHTPELEASAIAPRPALAPSRSPDHAVFWSTRRTAAVVVAGAGVLALAATTVFAVQAVSTNADAEPHCRGTTCDRVGAGLRTNAVAAGNLATMTAVVGLGLLGASCALWFTAADDRPHEAQTVDVAVGPARVELTGRF